VPLVVPSALDDLRQEHLAGAEQVADDVHAIHERALDDVERARVEVLAAVRLLDVLDDVLVDTLHQRVLDPLHNVVAAPLVVLRLLLRRRRVRLIIGNQLPQ